MSATFGERLRVTVFGQSHSEAMGAVVDGLPAGLRIDTEHLRAFLARRAPGQGPLTTARREPDAPEIIAGLADGVTCGAPLCILIRNTDARSRDYETLRRVVRPSHADYPAYVRFGGHNDIRGGGQFSGRLTAPLCAAGAVALQCLAARGVGVYAHIASIAGIKDAAVDPVSPDLPALAALAATPLPVLDARAGEARAQAGRAAAADGDSVGGVVECVVTDLPAGVGEPLYDSVESRLAALLFAVPAVKGVEFGAGFAAAALRGSENNDGYTASGGEVRTLSNHSGGICGGLTTGMPVVFRAAFKPTPSIARPQRTVALPGPEETTLTVGGRHDPCVVPRAVPVVEAAAALTMYDLLLCAAL